MGEEGTLLSMWGCSSLESCCHNIGAFLKLMIMIEDIKIKWCKYPILTYESMLLSRQVSHRSNLNHLFWNFEDSVLVETLSLREKSLKWIDFNADVGHNMLYLHVAQQLLTYYWLVFSINKLISMQDVGHNMLHLHVAQQLPPITLSSMDQWLISYQWQRCWAEPTISI